jgi:hypothetical protein
MPREVDILVLGSGVAGLTFAIKAAERYPEKTILVLTKTNKEGQFLIDNVKSDSFKIFALLDKNSNYLFDAAGEEIGFWTRDFRLTDSTQPTIQLQLFLPKQNIKILSQRLLTKGVFKIVYNQAIEKELAQLRPLFTPPADFEQIQYANADSTYIWIKGSFLADSVYRFANANNDTINYSFSSAIGIV